MILRHYDRWAAAFAALALAAGGAMRRSGSASGPEPVFPQSVTAPGEAEAKRPYVIEERIRWPEPAPERGWRYDVFTPPAVHRVEGAFRLAAPGSGGEAAPPAPDEVPVELLEVRADVFPLQLVGHAGTGRNVRGMFEIGPGGETVLARAGSRLPSLGLTVRTLEVKRPRAAAADGSPTTVATAVVVDELTGEETLLTTRERRLRSVPLAVLRLTESGSVRELRPGDRLDVGALSLIVDRIDVAPPAVRLAVRPVAEAAAEPRELTLTLQPGSH